MSALFCLRLPLIRYRDKNSNPNGLYATILYFDSIQSTQTKTNNNHPMWETKRRRRTKKREPNTQHSYRKTANALAILGISLLSRRKKKASQRSSVMAKGESELWPLNNRTLEKFDQCYNTNSQNTNNWPRSCALYGEKENEMREKKAKVTTTHIDSCRKIGCSSVPTRVGSSYRSAFRLMIHLTQSRLISANAHRKHTHTACIVQW